MPSLTQLTPEIWSRIAAGEVVERPASAVKELTENSLDAGASRIRVSLYDGGRLKIIVEDNGSGIPFDDLPLALAYHATSKLSSVEDLEHIMTLGYRGEALASLVAVADVELRSRTPDAQSGGIIRTHDGKITEHITASCPQGTRVQVSNLFSGLPARRKFLKSAAGELRRCAAFIREYAVCNPHISFTLEHDGKLVFSTDGAGNRMSILSKIWGEGSDIQHVDVKAGSTTLECWFQSRAGLSGRGDVMSFVNGRAVSDPEIRSALAKAARDLAGNWALFFTINPSLVDVNIHPAKSEVRFRYPGEIYKSVLEASKHLGSPATLDGLHELPQLRELHAPAETPRTYTPRASNGWNFRDSQSDILNTKPRTTPSYQMQTTPAFTFPDDNAKEEGQDTHAHSRIKYLGQSSGGYLVYDNGDALLLVDPHAAHERVNYERIKSRAEAAQNVQKLLVPVMLHPTLALEVREHERELLNAGFMFNNTVNGVELSAVPAIGNVEVEAEALLRVSLEALMRNHDGEAKALLWRTWATMACKASVKLTTELSEREALELWDELEECEQPSVCPHGRPVMIELRNELLLKRFGRE